MGFPSTVPQCSTRGCGTREVNMRNGLRTRIIPEMSFTCFGTVTHWRAAGEFRGRGNTIENPVLSIWRERSSEPGTFDRVDGIQLGICGNGVQAPLVIGTRNVYECTLPQSERVSVQPGDIVGIQLPDASTVIFRLHFNDATTGPTNYVFNSHGSAFSLSEASSMTPDQPQISLTVEPVITMTVPVLSSTQPLTTTAIDPPTTHAPTSTEATSMATTESPTTAKALTTAAATEPPTTITDALTTAVATEPTTITTDALTTAAATESPTTDALTTAAATEPPTTTTTEALIFTDLPSTQPLTAITVQTTSTVIMDSLTPTDDSNTDSPTKTNGRLVLTDDSRISQQSDNADLGLIVGSIVGGVVGIILLSAVIILTLALVYLARKYKRELRKREMIGMAKDGKALDVEVPLKAYIPIPNNVACGEMVSTNAYDPPFEVCATQFVHNEQNEGDTEEDHDIIN